MSDANGGAPAPVFDESGYTAVVVEKTDEVDGHVYRRGLRAKVDAATLAAMREKGMVPPEPAAPWALPKAGG